MEALEALDGIQKELLCRLCNLPLQDPQTFRTSCGHTFCRECVINTLEGPGIVTSQCPTCKQPGWKKDLQTNHKYTAIAEAVTLLTDVLKQEFAGYGLGPHNVLAAVPAAAPQLCRVKQAAAVAAEAEQAADTTAEHHTPDAAHQAQIAERPRSAAEAHAEAAVAVNAEVSAAAAAALFPAAQDTVAEQLGSTCPVEQRTGGKELTAAGTAVAVAPSAGGTQAAALQQQQNATTCHLGAPDHPSAPTCAAVAPVRDGMDLHGRQPGPTPHQQQQTRLQAIVQEQEYHHVHHHQQQQQQDLQPQSVQGLNEQLPGCAHWQFQQLLAGMLHDASILRQQCCPLGQAEHEHAAAKDQQQQQRGMQLPDYFTAALERLSPPSEATVLQLQQDMARIDALLSQIEHALAAKQLQHDQLSSVVPRQEQCQAQQPQHLGDALCLLGCQATATCSVDAHKHPGPLEKHLACLEAEPAAAARLNPAQVKHQIAEQTAAAAAVSIPAATSGHNKKRRYRPYHRSGRSNSCNQRSGAQGPVAAVAASREGCGVSSGLQHTGSGRGFRPNLDRAFDTEIAALRAETQQEETQEVTAVAKSQQQQEVDPVLLDLQQQHDRLAQNQESPHALPHSHNASAEQPDPHIQQRQRHTRGSCRQPTLELQCGKASTCTVHPLHAVEDTAAAGSGRSRRSCRLAAASVAAAADCDTAAAGYGVNQQAKSWACRAQPLSEEDGIIHAVSYALLGCHIEVFWPKDKDYYVGKVVDYNPKTQKFTVKYLEDSDQEDLALLKHQKWRFAAPQSPEELQKQQEWQAGYARIIAAAIAQGSAQRGGQSASAVASRGGAATSAGRAAAAAGFPEGSGAAAVNGGALPPPADGDRRSAGADCDSGCDLKPTSAHVAGETLQLAAQQDYQQEQQRKLHGLQQQPHDMQMQPRQQQKCCQQAKLQVTSAALHQGQFRLQAQQTPENPLRAGKAIQTTRQLTPAAAFCEGDSSSSSSLRGSNVTSGEESDFAPSASNEEEGDTAAAASVGNSVDSWCESDREIAAAATNLLQAGYFKPTAVRKKPSRLMRKANQQQATGKRKQQHGAWRQKKQRRFAVQRQQQKQPQQQGESMSLDSCGEHSMPRDDIPQPLQHQLQQLPRSRLAEKQQQQLQLQQRQWELQQQQEQEFAWQALQAQEQQQQSQVATSSVSTGETDEQQESWQSDAVREAARQHNAVAVECEQQLLQAARKSQQQQQQQRSQPQLIQGIDCLSCDQHLQQGQQQEQQQPVAVQLELARNNEAVMARVVQAHSTQLDVPAGCPEQQLVEQPLHRLCHAGRCAVTVDTCASEGDKQAARPSATAVGSEPAHGPEAAVVAQAKQHAAVVDAAVNWQPHSPPMTAGPEAITGAQAVPLPVDNLRLLDTCSPEIAAKRSDNVTLQQKAPESIARGTHGTAAPAAAPPAAEDDGLLLAVPSHAAAVGRMSPRAAVYCDLLSESESNGLSNRGYSNSTKGAAVSLAQDENADQPYQQVQLVAGVSAVAAWFGDVVSADFAAKGLSGEIPLAHRQQPLREIASSRQDARQPVVLHAAQRALAAPAAAAAAVAGRQLKGAAAAEETAAAGASKASAAAATAAIAAAFPGYRRRVVPIVMLYGYEKHEVRSYVVQLKQLGAEWAEKVDSKYTSCVVTHVDADGRARYTGGTTMLKALLYNVPVVRHAWLVDSLAAGQLLPVKEYLVRGICTVTGGPFDGGPTRSLQARHTHQQSGLFEGLAVVTVATQPAQLVSMQAIAALVKLGGASFVATSQVATIAGTVRWQQQQVAVNQPLTGAHEVAQCSRLLVLVGGDGVPRTVLKELFQKWRRAEVLKVSYVMDSICSYKLLDTGYYLVQPAHG